jgi:hypothetical protein
MCFSESTGMIFFPCLLLFSIIRFREAGGKTYPLSRKDGMITMHKVTNLNPDTIFVIANNVKQSKLPSVTE